VEVTRGTLRSLDAQQRKALTGAHRNNCWERQGGRPVSKALNVSVAILTFMRNCPEATSELSVAVSEGKEKTSQVADV